MLRIANAIHDAVLTDRGRQQAKRLASAFSREAREGIPLPEVWFTCPLKRTEETCGIEWG